MNWKKFLIAFVVTFVFVFFFGFVWHGILMKSAYMEIQSHYRAHDDMIWPSLILGHVVMAFFLTMLYARHGGGSISSGICVGILVGLILVGLHFVRFAVEPLTPKILLMGGIGDVLEFALAGALIGAIYKPSVSSGP
ncbi:MAG TPA: DUF1761 family protein [Chthoniobacterales bacterium]|nr:DUF1761 family protein [Chthoniobacterales bacterium]